MKNVRRVSKLLVSIGMLSGLAACSPEHVEVADACTVQLSEDDCTMVGNSILSLKGITNFACVWKEGACTMQSK